MTFIGCASDSGPNPTRGLDRADRVVEAGLDDAPKGRPPVIVEGEPIAWSALQPLLAEAAGAEAIQEVALDRLLDRALEREGLRVTQSEIERERSLLLSQVGSRGGGQDVLRQLRRVRGLGDVRFARTLERNAKLRALVAPGVVVSDEAIRQAYEIDHGEKVRVRLIVTPSDSAAQQARSSVGAGPGARGRFIEMASTMSTDPSSRVGGLVEPFSLADPTYPAGLRAVLRQTQTGAVTPVVALDEGGYAIAYVESRQAGSGRSLSSVRSDIERQVRLREERIAMDRLARTLLNDATITVFDPNLDWSWRNRSGS